MIINWMFKYFQTHLEQNISYAFTLLLSTEIFSKRRKIYTITEEKPEPCFKTEYEIICNQNYYLQFVVMLGINKIEINFWGLRKKCNFVQ